MFTFSLLLASSLCGLAFGAPERAQYGRGYGGNTPTSRSQWSNGFTVYDDTDKKWPVTGRVREYWWTLAEAKCNPDGFAEYDCQLINGQLPGPGIVADWGDTIRVHVYNALDTNGTSIHWHGLRQYRTNLQDGVGGVTECPLAPGSWRTYEFLATQYGTSWYHSHYSSQYGAGVLGPITIRGPASANYDIDLGPLTLSDWFHLPFYEAAARADETSVQGITPPFPSSYLLNGKGTDGQGHGEYHRIWIQPGKTHLLRLINSATESTMHFSIDNHTMTVISADFNPVKPFLVDSLMVGIAQRYDVLITANKKAASYWIRVVPESLSCAGPLDHPGLGVLQYANTRKSLPSTPVPTDAAVYGSNCDGPGPIRPIWDAGIPKDQFLSKYQPLYLTVDPTQPEKLNGASIIWKFNTSGIRIMWDKPTVTYVQERNTSYPASLAVFDLKNKGEEWAFFIIQASATPVSFISHPIHLHGHDFYTLGVGVGTFDPAKHFASLNFVNPPRRDTDYLPGDQFSGQGSWMAFAFQTGNPGAWLLHCHIGSHIAAGMGLQFLDLKSEIKGLDKSGKNICKTWSQYYTTAEYKETNSGL